MRWLLKSLNGASVLRCFGASVLRCFGASCHFVRAPVWRPLRLAVLCLAAITSITASPHFDARHQLNTSIQGTSLAQMPVERASEAVIQFGTLAAGDRAEKRVMLPNARQSSIVVNRVRTSCPCFSVDIPTKPIAAHETFSIVAVLDLSDDPLFTGGLRPEAQLLDGEGAELFSIIASAEVHAPDSAVARGTSGTRKQRHVREIDPRGWLQERP